MIENKDSERVASAPTAGFHDFIRAAALSALIRMHELSQCDDPAVAAQARQIFGSARHRIMAKGQARLGSSRHPGSS